MWLRLATTLLLLLLHAHPSLPCSIAGTLPPPHTMLETLYQADIVIHARDVAHGNTSNDDGFYDPVTLKVFCVFKDSSSSITSSTIVIDANRNTCSGTYTETGHDYLLALTVDDDRGRLIPDEPNVHETAAFEASTENLQKAATLCGLTNATALAGGTCPERQQGACVKAVYTGVGARQEQAGMVAMVIMIWCCWALTKT